VAQDDPNDAVPLELGDIVREHEAIIPPDRATWTGIVVSVDRYFYQHLFSQYDGNWKAQDSVGVQWFQAGYVEYLPASVLVLVQKAKQKTDKKS
jgi:hypothetical protein